SHEPANPGGILSLERHLEPHPRAPIDSHRSSSRSSLDTELRSTSSRVIVHIKRPPTRSQSRRLQNLLRFHLRRRPRRRGRSLPTISHGLVFIFLKKQREAAVRVRHPSCCPVGVCVNAPTRLGKGRRGPTWPAAAKPSLGAANTDAEISILSSEKHD
ncbi:unnamed protein product, partial [Linum tenue]